MASKADQHPRIQAGSMRPRFRRSRHNSSREPQTRDPGELDTYTVRLLPVLLVLSIAAIAVCRTKFYQGWWFYRSNFELHSCNCGPLCQSLCDCLPYTQHSQSDLSNQLDPQVLSRILASYITSPITMPVTCRIGQQPPKKDSSVNNYCSTQNAAISTIS